MSTSKRRKRTGAQEVVDNVGVSRSNQDITEFSGALREAYLQQLFFAIRDDLRQKLLTDRDWLPFNGRNIRHCLHLLKDAAPRDGKDYRSKIGALEETFKQIAEKMKSNKAFCLSVEGSGDQVSSLIAAVKSGCAANKGDLIGNANTLMTSAESFSEGTILQRRFKAFTGALKGESSRGCLNNTTPEILDALSETSLMLPDGPKPASGVADEMWQKIKAIVTQDSFQSKTGWRAIFNCFGVDRSKLAQNVTDAACNKNASQLRKAVYKFQKFWLPKKNLSAEIKRDLRMLNKYTALLSSHEVISEYHQHVPLPVNDDIGAGSFSFRSSSVGDRPSCHLSDWFPYVKNEAVAAGEDGQPADGALLSPKPDPRGIRHNCDYFFQRQEGKPQVTGGLSQCDNVLLDRLVALTGENVEGSPSIKCDPNPRRSFSFDPSMLPSFNPQTGSFSSHSFYRNGGGEVSGRNVSCDSTSASCH